MRPIRTFSVAPSLPAPIERLQELAYNLFWSWDQDARQLFVRLDRRLWEISGHNPVRMLTLLPRRRLEEAAEDEAFMAQYQQVCAAFDAYLGEAGHWFARAHPEYPPDRPLVAYFSAEFGLTESMPMYSGGLGNLAGDHLKSASDLGVPIVGVGLLYHQGYFRQSLSADGWQQESYPNYDIYTMPLQMIRKPDGRPLSVELALPGRTLTAYVWRVRVGRITLYLLDANAEANRPDDRILTDRLYGGDLEMRIRQEILLGIGGARALEAMGIRPAVYHMNEGHSAFLSLERIRRTMDEQDASFAEALEATAASQVFTTHTPVPAGHDYFPPDMMERYFGDFYRSIKLDRSQFLALGRQNPSDEREAFCMTILALRTAAYSNGVSRLHGAVARRMWQGIWPHVPEEELPIESITNGVHLASWVSDDMAALYDRYLGPRWRAEPDDPTVWRQALDIPPEELWRTHERRRERLIAFARRRLRGQMEARGAPLSDLAEAEQALDPRILTIGFARRFATYKRATLLLQAPERLLRLLTSEEHPVQILVAGKAHPRDDAGKEMIRQIVKFAQDPAVRRRLVFLEDYDIATGRYLVQGVDVWLNTPRRPEEASGTSGMKAAVNGAINVSILDGWWNEAYAPEVGWAIGAGGETPEGDAPDRGAREAATVDRLDAQALFDILEREVAPLFYDRGSDGLPREWIARMQHSIAAIPANYNTHRMVKEYTERFYVPAAVRSTALRQDGLRRARELAAWKAKAARAWPSVQVEEVTSTASDHMPAGQSMTIQAVVQLEGLQPEDVVAEVYLGRVDPRGELRDCVVVPMRRVGPTPDGRFVFEATNVTPHGSGQFGYQVRVRAYHPDLANPFETGLMRWAAS
ncbi:alpha-glucan family phosphorylase [Carboxydochorda subterranea]|uniref:Alpha-glucan family phosphorylase n=1 Tax=Carboxydichorda subterranea TaxID=3109565 RepID=A0ABZ1BU27_9FIRM|nr:alpha-glucan family phosphorylase [Limnochorda sp. L945t]WRP16098.1 alpha-glucan family phosphorylase [Limnochorda sp. L945t]